nr:uncharacterized protein LOC128684400 [Cherax quadricarinatus]
MIVGVLVTGLLVLTAVLTASDPGESLWHPKELSLATQADGEPEETPREGKIFVFRTITSVRTLGTTTISIPSTCYTPVAATCPRQKRRQQRTKQQDLTEGTSLSTSLIGSWEHQEELDASVVSKRRVVAGDDGARDGRTITVLTTQITNRIHTYTSFMSNSTVTISVQCFASSVTSACFG